MQLVFAVQPSATEGNVTLAPAPQVLIQDQRGNTDRGATIAVTLSLAPNANGAKLRGTVTVNAGSEHRRQRMSEPDADTAAR